MTWEAWLTIGVITVVFSLLALTSKGPDMILMAGVTVLMLTGVLTPEDALAGFSNTGVITIGVLYVVAEGLRETGSMTWLIDRIMKPTQSPTVAQARIMFPVAMMSGFLNNTPLVAMLLPGISDWGKKFRIANSKLLIPLSYAAILGGVCTLIGTSTNLLVDGMIQKAGLPHLGMFEITWIGIPVALGGITFVLITSRWLLPDRQPAVSTTADPREYTLEMVVESGSPLIGQTIEAAGLRHLPGLYLMEIDRQGRILPAVGSLEQLCADDRLIFVGKVDSIVDLQKVRGLKPATNQVFKLNAPRSERCLIEAVVSNSCPIVGKTIREGRFRSLYNAAVIAVARNGERIRKKIGDIVLQPGDTLLLEALPSFVDRQRDSRDFYLVGRLEDSTPPNHDRMWISLLILAAMVAVVTFNWLSMLEAGLVAAGLMIVTRCCSGESARRSVSWRLLVTISGALGIGRAMEVSGAAETIANAFIQAASGDPWLTLVAVFLVTMMFTELVTNNAAAAIVFPIALSAANSLHVNFVPFAMAIMIAASASFATPIGYQTNLMVYGAGGYKFSDFIKIGVPLSAVIAVITLALIPIIWPLR